MLLEGRKLELSGRTVAEQAEVDMMIDVAGDYRGTVTNVCYRYYKENIASVCTRDRYQSVLQVPSAMFATVASRPKILQNNTKQAE
jgi:hypothetical protein